MVGIDWIHWGSLGEQAEILLLPILVTLEAYQRCRVFVAALRWTEERGGCGVACSFMSRGWETSRGRSWVYDGPSQPQSTLRRARIGRQQASPD